ncbi:MAG: YraN family protein [Bacillota bacterium]|nr:YraN family protein [Bacillota bacterium]
MDNRLIGQIGENAAADILMAKGYTILKRNYRCKHGEIDIIAEKYGEMSFVEVKTRQSYQFGRPCEAVSEEKKRHIRKTARCYLDELRAKGYIPRRYDFQIVEVTIQHMEHVF